MKLEGTSFIGNRRAKAAGKPTAALNPATGAALAPVYYWATAADVDAAAELAGRAFLEYSQWPATRRAEFLRRIAERLEANAAAIVERAQQETALATQRLQGELARTCFQLRLYGDAFVNGLCLGARIDHGDPQRQPQPKPDVRSLLRPVGPVAVFSATNFPLAYSVAGGDTASALAAGCPVIVKPNQGHLGTSEIVARLILDAASDVGAPEGIFSMIYGSGKEIGIALVRHPFIKAVGFTGSRAGGRALMDAAAGRPEPIPVYAEMASTNPVFLLPGALAAKSDALATGLHSSVTLGVGQFCTCPGLIFTEPGPTAERFLEKLAALMSATPAATMLTADICANYREGIEHFAKAPGVRRVAGSAATGSRKTEAGAALFATEAGTFLKDDRLMEEVFGPSTIVIQCASREQMIEAAKKLEGQLTATIHGTPEELAANR
ncbi:MAG TPA: aldehyde dehydrogenase (NADP(+)), partial [Verrucomicrobiae bacterium]|nr:aldehyde dehydrogenase (NADP(+)) [Verrucomicrobiae bacterium]